MARSAGVGSAGVGAAGGRAAGGRASGGALRAMSAVPAHIARGGWHTVAVVWRFVIRMAGRIDVHAATMAAAILIGIVQIAIETPSAVVGYDVPIAPAFILVLLHAGSVPLAVLRPRSAVALSVLAAIALQLLSADSTGTGIWPWSAPMMVTQITVVCVIGLRSTWGVAVVCWLAGVVGSSIVAMVLRPADTDATSVNIVVFAAISGGGLVLAIVGGQWREIRAQLLTERRVSAEEYSLRVLADERARIARELHDVIAHSMSMINVQATTARYRNPDFDERAIAEFSEIGASSRQALDEMRGLLGVLRDGEHPGERAPQPRFADIPDLVAQAERAGMRVSFEWVEGADRVGVGDLTGLAAYRIVQEALSNAIRHAPGTDVEVTCRRSGETVVLTIQNSAPSTVAASGLPGHGLIGMSERATGVAGRVAFGPTAAGGFIVRAVLPVRGTQLADRTHA